MKLVTNPRNPHYDVEGPNRATCGRRLEEQKGLGLTNQGLLFVARIGTIDDRGGFESRESTMVVIVFYVVSPYSGRKLTSLFNLRHREPSL